MGYIKSEDIAGFQLETGVYHEACVDTKELELTEDNYITTDMVEDGNGTYFCDQCKKEL